MASDMLIWSWWGKAMHIVMAAVYPRCGYCGLFFFWQQRIMVCPGKIFHRRRAHIQWGDGDVSLCERCCGRPWTEGLIKKDQVSENIALEIFFANKSKKILVLTAHYATLLNRRVLISSAPKSVEGMAMGSDNLKNITMWLFCPLLHQNVSQRNQKASKFDRNFPGSWWCDLHLLGMMGEILLVLQCRIIMVPVN